MSIIYFAAPLSWQMMFPASSGSDDLEPEEVVMRLQGVLCNKDLLPIFDGPKYIFD